MPSFLAFWACPSRWKSLDGPRAHWRNYVSPSGLGAPKGPSGRAGKRRWWGEDLEHPAEPAEPATRPKRKKMDILISPESLRVWEHLQDYFKVLLEIFLRKPGAG